MMRWILLMVRFEHPVYHENSKKEKVKEIDGLYEWKMLLRDRDIRYAELLWE